MYLHVALILHKKEYKKQDTLRISTIIHYRISLAYCHILSLHIYLFISRVCLDSYEQFRLVFLNNPLPAENTNGLFNYELAIITYLHVSSYQ